MLIQQIIASILTFLLCFVCNDKVMAIGEKLGLDGVLAWGVVTFAILLCVWRLSSREWGLPDAIAAVVIAVLGMLYVYDLNQVFVESFKVILGVGVGALIGFLARRDD